MLGQLFAKASVAAVLVVSAAAAATANPVLLFEPASGQVLHAEDPDRSWHPASVTKLMTAYLTFEAVKAGRLAWDADVPLSDHARGQPATRIGLKAGIRLNVEQAVRGLILRSANDFATALAETVAGNEERFATLMNDTARRLGMTRTTFRNPHGLPDAEQVTTARDLATLTTALLRDFPDRAEVFSTPTVVIHKGTFHSQNDLLRDLDGGDGMKTGFTCASGYNVVASATRNGRRLVAIVLGAPDRTSRSARASELLEAGFAELQGGEVAEAAAASHTRPALAFAGNHLHLAALPLSPAEAVPAYDMSHETLTHKCGNGRRIARRVPKRVPVTAAAGAAATPAVQPKALKATAAVAAQPKAPGPAAAPAKAVGTAVLTGSGSLNRAAGTKARPTALAPAVRARPQGITN